MLQSATTLERTRAPSVSDLPSLTPCSSGLSLHEPVTCSTSMPQKGFSGFKAITYVTWLGNLENTSTIYGRYRWCLQLLHRKSINAVRRSRVVQRSLPQHPSKHCTRLVSRLQPVQSINVLPPRAGDGFCLSPSMRLSDVTLLPARR